VYFNANLLNKDNVDFGAIMLSSYENSMCNGYLEPNITSLGDLKKFLFAILFGKMKGTMK